MRLIAAVLLGLFGAACGFTHSEKHLNLTGSWAIDKAATRLQLLKVENLERATLEINQSESSLRCTRVFAVGGRENTFSFELPLDGKEVTTTAGGQTRYSRLYREGDALVYYTRIVESAGESTNVVHYRLSADGNTLQAEERRRGTDNYDNLWVFKRQR